MESEQTRGRMTSAGGRQACGPSASCEMAGGILPTLILIGTRKGGTTALSNLLRDHPSVRMPDCKRGSDSWPPVVRRTMCVWDKEVRYFSRGLRSNLVGPCWYRSLYPCPILVGHKDDRLVAYDGSPDYLVMPEASVIEMRAQLGPAARLVALLRNPSDRFYSAYNMGMNEMNQKTRKRAGETVQETYASFASRLDRMIACAPDCPNEQSVVSMFFNFGLYARHLSKFIRHFGREALLIEASEDFYRDPQAIMARVVAFAGLPLADGQSTSQGARSHDGTGGRNSGRVWGGDGYTGKLEPAERAKLDAFYQPHNLELYALISRDFKWSTPRAEGGVPARNVTKLSTVDVAAAVRAAREQFKAELMRAPNFGSLRLPTRAEL